MRLISEGVSWPENADDRLTHQLIGGFGHLRSLFTEST